MIPDVVTTISQSAFSGCTALGSVILPADLRFIESGAFYNCSSLESIVIPDGVTEIKDHTFYGCRSLEAAVLPVGIRRIQYGAFEHCGVLRNVYYCGSEEEWNRIDIDNKHDSNHAVESAAPHFDYVPISGGNGDVQ